MRKALMLWCVLLGLAFSTAAEARCIIKWQAEQRDSWPSGIDCLIPIFRVDLGAAFRVSPVTETRFALNLVGGALMAWPGNHGDALANEAGWLLPEVGYSLRYHPSGDATQLLSLGVGVGYGLGFMALAMYTPRFVVGKTGDELTLGFRHGIAGHFFVGSLSLELAHEVLSTAGVLSHDILLTLGINPAPLIAVITS